MASKHVVSSCMFSGSYIYWSLLQSKWQLMDSCIRISYHNLLGPTLKCWSHTNLYFRLQDSTQSEPLKLNYLSSNMYTMYTHAMQHACMHNNSHSSHYTISCWLGHSTGYKLATFEHVHCSVHPVATCFIYWLHSKVWYCSYSCMHAFTHIPATHNL